MCISEDEYDRQLGGAIELSTEDGAKLDALSTTDFGLHEPIPHINVEWETPQTSKTPRVEPFKANSTSPFKRYRQRGYLSVTDLVAPTWQVSSDYLFRIVCLTRVSGAKFNSNMGFSSTGQES